jgi:eukaryotic-like serine/threonine-protein kinase
MVARASDSGVASNPAGPRAGHAAFRWASGTGTPLHTSSELEEQLRQRLRVAFTIWAVAAIAIATTAGIARREHLRHDPLTFFTEPPLPGVLFLIAAVTFATMTSALSPGRQLGLARLRRVEWLGVVVTAAFFVTNQTRALAGLIPELSSAPMDLGLGLAAPWGALIVAYGVLIPSSVRQGLARTLVLACCAFIPELVSLPNAQGLGKSVTSYLVLKAVMITAMSALAVYGAYRIEVLRQDAQEARQLGQYVLQRILGSGGMGEVHLAKHQFLRRPCAVKLIRAERAGDGAALARFEREVQAASGLTHPNTVQIYDYGHSADGTFYYVMEYLPGISLEDLVVRHGPIPPARAVRILVQICGALSEAHRLGLVHRDLKPGNVMLCERGGLHDVAKLLDFGLVYQESSASDDPKLTQAGAILGTPAFMSPEQCGGEETVTAASDLYSLGAIGFFLLAGRPPFIKKSAIQMVMAHLLEAPPTINTLRDGIPTSLADVIARCLAKDPSDRYPTAVDLEVALRSSIELRDWTDEHAHQWWIAHEAVPVEQS